MKPGKGSLTAEAALIPASHRLLEADRDAVMLWMLDNQGGRRNLTDIDRIAIVRRREEILARKALENKVSAGGDRTTVEGKALLMKSPKALTPVHTRAESAKAAGVGEHKYNDGKLTGILPEKRYTLPTAP